MKKAIALLLGLSMAVTCFVGCNKKKEAPAAKDEEKVAVQETAASFEGQTLVVYTDMNEGDAEHTAYMEQVGKFEEKTGADVEVLCFGAQLQQGYDGAIEAGKTVDIYKVPSLYDYRFEVSHALDLSPYAEASEIPGKAYGAYMDQIRLFTESGQSIQGVPTTADLSGMWYSVVAFEAAGASVPTTVEEFETTCEKLKAAGYSPVIVEEPNAALNFAVHMERALGEQTWNDLTRNGGWAANSEAVAACQKLLDWAGKGYFAVVAWPLSWEAMGSTAAMTYTSWVDIGQYEGLLAQDVKLDCFAYPAQNGVGRMAFDCGVWCVSADTQVGELAWEFLAFMSTGEADAAVAAAAGTIPCDRTNTNGDFASAVKMLSSAAEKYDDKALLAVNADVSFAEVALNIYNGSYADGAEAAAALDALY